MTFFICFCVFLICFGLACEVEEFGDLVRYRGHDGGVEERVKTAEEESTDDNGNENLTPEST